MRMYSNERALHGIYRANVIEAEDYSARIYIPALHKSQMPFKNMSNPSEGIETTDEGLITTSEGTLAMKLHDYPLAPLSSMFAVFPLSTGDAVWVVFENGDANYPVIVGQLGSTLPENDFAQMLASSNGSENGEGGTYGDGSYVDVGNFKLDYSKIKGWGYPLSSKHTCDPTTDGRAFGASRNNGNRAHAGIDLIVAPGVKVIAMDDGTVCEMSYGFYGGTDAIAIKHTNNYIARYCEIRIAKGLNNGSAVKKGQCIGEVIANNIGHSSMLHIECYNGTGSGSLSGGNGTYTTGIPQRNYQRRSDLMNPTFIASLPSA